MLYRGLRALVMCREILAGVAADGRYPLHVGDCGYYRHSDGTYTAWDNTTGDCWVEDFKTKKEVQDWLTI